MAVLPICVGVAVARLLEDWQVVSAVAGPTNSQGRELAGGVGSDRILVLAEDRIDEDRHEDD